MKKYWWLRYSHYFKARPEVKRAYFKYPEYADTIAMTYLDILLAVVDKDGVFTVGEGGESLTEDIAITIGRDMNTVDFVCQYLQETHAMIILEENRKADFPYLREIVGSETDSAGRMRKKRERDKESSQSDGDASQSDIEKETEKDRDTETDTETEEDTHAHDDVGADAPTSARSAHHARACEEVPVEDRADIKEADAPEAEPYESQALTFCAITRNRTDISDALRMALKKWFVDKEERGQPYKLGPMKGTIDSAVKYAGIYGEDCVIRIIENCLANGYNRLNFEQWDEDARQ